MTTYVLRGIFLELNGSFEFERPSLAFLRLSTPDNIASFFVTDPLGNGDTYFNSSYLNAALSVGEFRDSHPSFRIQTVEWGSAMSALVLTVETTVGNINSVSMFQISGDSIPSNLNGVEMTQFLATAANSSGVNSGLVVGSSIRFDSLASYASFNQNDVFGPGTAVGFEDIPIILNSGSGNDIVIGGDFDDRMWGGSGNDIIHGGAALDSIYGGLGDDTIFGGLNVTVPSWTQLLYDDNGDDFIYGGEGNDILKGAPGDDFMFGGFGNDTISGDSGWIFDFSDYNGLDTRDTIYGDVGNDIIDGEYGTDFIYGGSDDDVLYGGGGNDLMFGGIGNDRIDGGPGSDRAYFTDSTSATVNLSLLTAQVTGQGTDTLTRIEHVSSGSGNDRLTGNSLANSLSASAGNDTVDSGAGNDALYGADGNDLLTGGIGNDRIDGGLGSDRAYFTGTVAATVNLSILTAQVTGYGTDTLAGIEHLSSGSSNDRLTGDALGNSLVSGAGNDTVNGAAGNDALYGGAGNDLLTGGAGNDRFSYAAQKEAGDRVSDFIAADDTFVFQTIGFNVFQAGSFSNLALGSLNAARFRTGSTNAAADSNDFFIFRTTDTTLWFDADGNGTQRSAILIADLQTGATMSAADVLLI